MIHFNKNIQYLLFSIGILVLFCTKIFAQEESIKIIQVTDPQFGFFAENKSFDKETELYTKTILIINELKPDFVVITGDFVNNSKDTLQIKEFKRITSLIDKGIPVYLSPGNHDLGQSPSKDDFEFYFSNYGKGSDRFSFKQNNSTFIGFNSVIIKSEKNSKDEKKQFRWLKRQLRKAKKSDNIVLFTHYPFFLHDFNEKVTYSNQSMEARNKYFRLFEKYGVDAIFAGHLHDNAEASYNGILMITTSAAGRPLGEAKPGVRLISIDNNSVQNEYTPLN
jgi:3',5'-cyclic AMP phosphodiesterase CpdA